MPTGGGKSLCYQVPALVRPGVGRRRLPADRADAGPGRRAARARRPRRVPQLHAEPRRAPRRRARLPRRRARPALPRPGAAAGAVHAVRCWTGARSRCSPSTRRTASRSGATTSGPTTSRSPTCTSAGPTCPASRSRPRHASPRTPRSRTGSTSIDAKHVVASFDRPNIQYRIAPKNEPRRQLLDLLRTEHPGDAGIVYCLSRKSVEQTAEFLVAQGITALPYHAGLDAAVRAPNQSRFLREDGRRHGRRRSRSAWASTSPTSGSSPTSTCRSPSRATTRRPAAPAATGCRPRRGWPTASPTSCSSAR